MMWRFFVTIFLAYNKPNVKLKERRKPDTICRFEQKKKIAKAKRLFNFIVNLITQHNEGSHFLRFYQNLNCGVISDKNSIALI